MDQLKVLSSEQQKQICIDCGAECCKRYWITLLPNKAEEIAAHLNMGFEDFAEKHAQLYLQLIPVPLKLHDGLFFDRTQLSEKLLHALKTKSITEKFFFVMPSIALKRNSKEDGKKHCTFLKQDQTCSIYQARPTQCQLFPYVLPDTVEKLEKLYPFCGLIKSTQPEPEKIKEHEAAVKAYFENVKEKGFHRLWKALPKKGVALVNGKPLAKIDQTDINALFQN